MYWFSGDDLKAEKVFDTNTNHHIDPTLRRGIRRRMSRDLFDESHLASSPYSIRIENGPDGDVTVYFANSESDD